MANPFSPRTPAQPPTTSPANNPAMSRLPMMLKGLAAQQVSVPPPPASDAADVDPNNADYEPPEDGPFRCDNCSFYSDPNQCTQPVVVKTQHGVVDAGGCCKFFKSLTAPQTDTSEQA